MKLKFIPPYSMFIGHGDLVHAGTGTTELLKDSHGFTYCFSCLHAYMGRVGTFHSDSINTICQQGGTFQFEYRGRLFDTLQDVFSDMKITEYSYEGIAS